jgi:DedD protein
MASSETGNKETGSDVSDIKRKLAWRMGFAALMIIALLGGLALFDYLGQQNVSETVAPPQFTEPVPVAKKLVTQPVTPAEPAPEVKKDEKKTAEPESTSAPVDKSAPRMEPPPRPEVTAQPALPRASQPAARPAAATSQAVAPVPAKPVETKVVTPPGVAPAPTQPLAAAQPAPTRLFSGYALQAGVFADPRRAEELHARLVLEGIPSTIEARVQVGPFKSKAEAEAAREKMKALGIEAVMLLPKGARR